LTSPPAPLREERGAKAGYIYLSWERGAKAVTFNLLREKDAISVF
jgi:hypothetical protein